MLKIVEKEKYPLMSQMQPGEIAVVMSEPYKGHIVYCFEHKKERWCVGLNHPESVWPGIETNHLDVRILIAGETLEVYYREYEDD